MDLIILLINDLCLWLYEMIRKSWGADDTSNIIHVLKAADKHLFSPFTEQVVM